MKARGACVTFIAIISLPGLRQHVKLDTRSVEHIAVSCGRRFIVEGWDRLEFWRQYVFNRLLHGSIDGRLTLNRLTLLKWEIPQIQERLVVLEPVEQLAKPFSHSSDAGDAFVIREKIQFITPRIQYENRFILRAKKRNG